MSHSSGSSGDMNGVSCPMCTFVNEIDKKNCEVCLHSLSSSSSSELSGNKVSEVIDVDSLVDGISEKSSENDVVDCLRCPRCTFDNVMSSSSCAICAYSFDDKLSVKSNKLVKAPPLLEMGGRGSEDMNEVLEDGLIDLLETALLNQNHFKQSAGKKRKRVDSSFSLCSAFTPHITQIGVYEGANWSCGYRNIQMLCYSLQRIQSQYGTCHKLFSRDGCVPDVGGLQSWIEQAWNAGFDREGCQHFGGRLIGSNEWIGATECAALLRFLGHRAEIVDFIMPDVATNTNISITTHSNPFTLFPLLRWVKDYFDYYHPFLKPPYPGLGSSPEGSFSRKETSSVPNARPPLAPLYFQHQGHSRTIIGYEHTSSRFSLLLFDPASSGRKLRIKLEQFNGWQCVVKRGAHTLNCGQYQIVYVAPGSVLKPGTPEYEMGKILRSTVFR